MTAKPSDEKEFNQFKLQLANDAVQTLKKIFTEKKGSQINIHQMELYCAYVDRLDKDTAKKLLEWCEGKDDMNILCLVGYIQKDILNNYMLAQRYFISAASKGSLAAVYNLTLYRDKFPIKLIFVLKANPEPTINFTYGGKKISVKWPVSKEQARKGIMIFDGVFVKEQSKQFLSRNA
jgi:hypothetical protein